MRNSVIDAEKTPPSKAIRQLFLNVCIGFTVLMVASMVAAPFFAGDEAMKGIMMCWGMLAVMLVAAVLQMLFFTPLVIKRMRYGGRVAAFGACFYVVLAALGALFSWFPEDDPGMWLGFTLSYLAILAIMTAVFTLVYRKNARELNEALGRYKEARAPEEC